MMASATPSETDVPTGNALSQHKWASWSDADKPMAKDSTKDGATDFETKRPGSAKLWSHAVAGISPHSIKFFAGNPSVEKTEGIIHLYREEYVTNRAQLCTNRPMIF